MIKPSRKLLALILSIALTVSVALPAAAAQTNDTPVTLGASSEGNLMTVSGTVMGGNVPYLYRPIANARLTFTLWEIYQKYYTITDANGCFKVEDMPYCSEMNISIGHSDYFHQESFLQLTSGDHIADFHLYPLQPDYIDLKYYIYDAETKLPIKDAIVYQPTKNISTNEDGFASVPVEVPLYGWRVYEPVFEKEGYEPYYNPQQIDTSTLIEPPAPKTIYMKPIDQGGEPNHEDNNSAPDSSSSGSGQSSVTTPTAPRALTPAQLNLTSTGPLSATNYDLIPLTTLRKLNGKTLHADTREEGRIIGRMYLAPTAPTVAINPTIRVTPATAQIKRRFPDAKEVIRLDQNGPYGMRAEVAVKVSLEGLDAGKLKLYLLQNGVYTLLQDSEYFIDTAGYLHFKTDTGGTVVVTD